MSSARNAVDVATHTCYDCGFLFPLLPRPVDLSFPHAALQAERQRGAKIWTWRYPKRKRDTNQWHLLAQSDRSTSRRNIKNYSLEKQGDPEESESIVSSLIPVADLPCAWRPPWRSHVSKQLENSSDRKKIEDVPLCSVMCYKRERERRLLCVVENPSVCPNISVRGIEEKCCVKLVKTDLRWAWWRTVVSGRWHEEKKNEEKFAQPNFLAEGITREGKKASASISHALAHRPTERSMSKVHLSKQ